MCTVSFIAQNKKVLIASNRDEKDSRKKALPPQAYKLSSGTAYFPKDGQAGGTWIAIHQNGNAMILLNGGFKKHIPEYPYRRSRGLIFLDIFDTKNPLVAFAEIDLDNIEPFTIVIWHQKKVFECRWDGERKYHKELDPFIPGIWSSATLYPGDIVSKREEWFRNWLRHHPEPTLDELMHFHQFTGDGDIENDLLMNRNDELRTISITGFEISEESAAVKYIDFQSDRSFKSEFALRQTVSV